MREERPLTGGDRELLALRARGQRRLSIALGVLAGVCLAAACGVAWMATARRLQAGLPACCGLLLLLLRHFLAGDPGRARDLAGGRKVVLRGPLRGVSAIPHRGLWIVRIEIEEERLKLHRRKDPGWVAGDELEVHYSPASRDVLWASRNPPPSEEAGLTGARFDSGDPPG